MNNSISSVALRLALLLAVARLAPQLGLSAEAERPQYTGHATADRFAAVTDVDGAVRLVWHTTLEIGVGGFRVLRTLDDGTTQTVGADWLPSQGDEEGAQYELADPAAKPGQSLRYDLWTVSGGQPGQWVAGWQGVPALLAAPPRMAVTAAATPMMPATLATQPWVGTGNRVQTWTNSLLPADRVRLSLREAGVYRVSAQELATAMGRSAAILTDALANTNLAVSCQGQPVAWYGEGTNLYFYGLPAASRYAPENVYWVSLGSGSAMTNGAGAWPDLVTTNASFPDTVERTGTTYLARVSYSSLADAPAPYVGHAPVMNGGGNFQSSEPLADPAPGPWTGAVTVSLLSYYEDGTDHHAARVSVGGVVVGQTNWSGEQCLSATYPFSSTNLAVSTAALRIDNTLAANKVGDFDNTRFYCFTYRFAYPRLYRARGGELRCTGGAGNTVAVSGFATNDVLALDVTDPGQPALATPAVLTWHAGTTNWTAAFPCGGTDRVYVVCSRATGIRLPSVRGVRNVDWTASVNGMDYAILIPPEAWRTGFREAVQPLAEFRSRRGLATQVIDVESIYNRFSHGLVDPEAIHAFCIAGRAWDGHPLRYLLLTGAGALDFKQQRLGVNDYTACLIPTVIRGQRFAGGSEGMTVAADHAFGDVDGDNVPEVAVGRLPTTKTQEVAIAVQKTIAYELAPSWRRQFSLAADWSNTGLKYYNFTGATDRLVSSLLAANRSVVKHYPPPGDTTGNLAPVRTGSLYPALAAGSGIFHFFGHSDEQNLGGSADGKLLTSPTHISSANWQKPTIAVVVGCRANRWQSLTTTVCILPYGLFAANTGFAAALGSTGYWLATEGDAFAVDLYTRAAANGTLRIGDALNDALRQNSGMPPERLQCFSIIGDPALMFRNPPPFMLIVR